MSKYRHRLPQLKEQALFMTDGGLETTLIFHDGIELPYFAAFNLLRDDVGTNRERIRGEGWARNRLESRAVTYECVVNGRTNRVVTASYEMRPRGRYSSLY